MSDTDSSPALREAISRLVSSASLETRLSSSTSCSGAPVTISLLRFTSSSSMLPTKE